MEAFVGNKSKFMIILLCAVLSQASGHCYMDSGFHKPTFFCHHCNPAPDDPKLGKSASAGSHELPSWRPTDKMTFSWEKSSPSCPRNLQMIWPSVAGWDTVISQEQGKSDWLKLFPLLFLGTNTGYAVHKPSHFKQVSSLNRATVPTPLPFAHHPVDLQ